MILKVVDALKSFSRTDPECKAPRDLGVKFSAACCEIRIILFLLDTPIALLRGRLFQNDLSLNQEPRTKNQEPRIKTKTKDLRQIKEIYGLHTRAFRLSVVPLSEGLLTVDC